jgi:hypothetical protein
MGSMEIRGLEVGRKQKGRREWEVVAGNSKKGIMGRNGRRKGMGSRRERE